MTGGIPVQAPITGAEDVHDPLDPVAALSRFYRAFNTRDLLLMESCWDQTTGVSEITPQAGALRGWEAIRLSFERLFRTRPIVTTEFYDYTISRYGDLFYAVGRERARASSNGDARQLAFHTTSLFHRSRGNGWRLVHHHVSLER
jgi:ketosteroid isomerase-like protein